MMNRDTIGDHMSIDTACGAAIWGPGSITRPPIGHCILPLGHDGEHKKPNSGAKTAAGEQLDLDLNLDCIDPYDTWKPNRDIACGSQAVFSYSSAT